MRESSEEIKTKLEALQYLKAKEMRIYQKRRLKMRDQRCRKNVRGWGVQKGK